MNWRLVTVFPTTELGGTLSAKFGSNAIVLFNENTTVGYVNYSCREKRIDYIFVNPRFRRKGVGRHLVALCANRCGALLEPAPPISPLGQALFKSIDPARCCQFLERDGEGQFPVFAG